MRTIYVKRQLSCDPDSMCSDAAIGEKNHDAQVGTHRGRKPRERDGLAIALAYRKTSQEPTYNDGLPTTPSLQEKRNDGLQTCSKSKEHFKENRLTGTCAHEGLMGNEAATPLHSRGLADREGELPSFPNATGEN